MGAEQVAQALGGKKVGSQWMVPCVAHDDRTPSLGITEGPDGKVLVRCYAGCPQDAVISALKALGLWPEYKRPENHGRAKDTAKLVSPIPAGTKVSLPPHPKHGKESRAHVYRDTAGRVLCLVCRYETEAGKTFSPYTMWRRSDGGLEWRAKAYPTPRPLYGLEKLSTDLPVIIHEGEKCVDAARELLPDYIHVTSSNGSKAANKADWSPLKGREVLIWPDNDSAGQKYAEAVAGLVSDAKSVTVLDPAVIDDCPAGFDAADATLEQAELILQSEQTLEPEPQEAESDNGSAASILVKLTDAKGELVHDKDRVCYALMDADGYRETLPLKSERFRIWASRQVYEATRSAPNPNALEQAITTLEGKALYAGREAEVHLRVAKTDDSYWIDLCDDRWRAVQVDRNGWRIVDQPPVIFRRTNNSRELPIPESGGTVDELVNVVNVIREELPLVITWVLESWRPDTPFPILELCGEQGSAKSTTQDRLRDLIDPNKSNLRVDPHGTKDLYVGASQNWVCSYNNLSHLSDSMQDALCCLSTGGGYAARTLYSDLEETVAEIKRPVVINGISVLAHRQDMVDRTIRLMLPPIAPEARRQDGELNREFERIKPRLFGALRNVFSDALKELPTVRLSKLPRMADFAIFGEAVCRAMRWPEEFEVIYTRVRREAVEVALDSSPAIVALRRLMDSRDEFEGTIQDLLDLIKPPEYSDGFPKAAKGLANILRAHRPGLRDVGVYVEWRERGSKGQNVYINKSPGSSTPSTPSTQALEYRPLSAIQCSTCRHFERDTVNPEGGYGGCTQGFEGH